jgi:hypothetical protein
MVKKYDAQKIQEIKEILPTVHSYTELAKSLGRVDITYLSAICKREQLDTTHFVGSHRFQKGHISSTRRSDYDVFITNSTYCRRLIKQRILDQNLMEYKCAICNIGPVWNNKPMPLILDHINGINNDNKLTNLRFVCSNCDSQLDTYKSKNRRLKQ